MSGFEFLPNIAIISVLNTLCGAPHRAACDGETKMGTLVNSSSALLAASLLALTLAGCTSSRFGSIDSGGPAPVAAAPSGTVTSTQLPPPQPAPGTTAAGAFPPPPTTPGTTPQTEEQMQIAAANAPDVTAGSVAGVWNATVGGMPCRVATPQTKFGQGYRAGPLRCPPPFDGVKSWNVEGKQLSFYDEGGNVLARLYSSGEQKFDGQTTSGQPISLSRQ